MGSGEWGFGNGGWGFGNGWCFPVFPKVDTPYGQVPMGLEGSGASRRPGSIVRVLRTERWVQPTERAGSEGSLICRCGGRKTIQPPWRARNAIPLWWLAPPPCPVGSMSLDSRVAWLPYESSSFATPAVRWAAKGKRLNGQARRLTSPHLEVLCRTSTGDYKAPLCCELLMRGLLCGSLLSHRSAGGRWCRKAPKGGKPPEVADYRSTYHTI